MASESQQGRISMLERKEVAADLVPLYDKLLQDRGVIPFMFKTVAHVPELALGFAALLKPLMGEGALPAWYKELVATRVAYLNNCEYCISAHTYQAKVRGASDAQIDGLHQYETAPFTEREKAGFRYADRLHSSAQAIDDAFYAVTKVHFDDREIIELTAVAAAFEFFPRFVSALDIPVTPLPTPEMQEGIARP
jgi:uncharacterized peroxidase-related enzyme